MNTLFPIFQNPGPAYRGKPFWSWNGELNEAELLRQIHVFKEMGFGGFFMHSRTGLATEYLGEEWFRLTNVCADEAAKLGMEAWLYDEDRWPSGTAGGLVTHPPEHRAKYLSLRFIRSDAFTWDDDIIAAFTCRLNGIIATDCQRLSKGTPMEPDATVLVFRIELGEESTFYNNATYVDTLSRRATDAYLKITHDQYQARCGDRLGKSIRGIFTDEPHRGPVMCGFSISNENKLWMTPWTETLFDEFKTAFGYDLIDRLPELFLQVDGEAVSPVKWQYMELTQRLFLKNFAAPMFEWCTQHNLELTGHVLHEDSLTAQSCMQGSMMRFYEYMHLPGIDILSEGNRCYWVVKQLSSAARQLGQKWMLSELYGCTGWQMTFEQHKAVGDWQALFGINVRCHHLSWYTMAGEAKRDYPASISFQSAWWPEYKHVEDYFARVGALLTHGDPVCDVLVINPVESVWCQVHGGWSHSLSPQDQSVKDLETGYAELFHWLSGAQIDFDYGDEEMLSRLSSIETGADGAAVVRVGKALYKTLVVGRQTTIRGSTVRLLEAFAKAGGNVVFAGPASAYVDAIRSPGPAEFARHVTQTAWDSAAVVKACASAAGLRAEVIGTDGKRVANIFCQIRRDAEGNVVMVLLNVDRDLPVNGARVLIRGGDGATQLAEWDCDTGERYAAKAAFDAKGETKLTIDFPAGGLRAYVIGKSAADGLSARPEWIEAKQHALGGPFKYELAEPNVCVLDRATYQIDEGAWQPATEVLKIDRAVRKAYGLKRRAGDMVQPWFRRRTEPQAPVRGRVKMKFSFEVNEMPTGDIDLGIEQPERFAITINGQSLASSSMDAWWIDPAIRCARVPLSHLHQGLNEVSLEVDFDEGINIEAIYLLGSFGVTLTGTQAAITTLRPTLRAGDVTAQGLPFYGGGIRYFLPVPNEANSEGMILELPKLEAACAKVVADHVAPKLIAWQPLKVEVSDFVTKGTIALDVVLTRRNTFGPLHQLPLRTPNYGPDNFTTTGTNWSDEYVLYPAGLLEAPVLIEASQASSNN